MLADRTNDATSVRRRIPRQERSRRRVESFLEAAEAMVVEEGVEALTTRGIAERAGAPVASLYQYFADKEAVLLALVERDMAEMDERVLADLDALEQPTVATLVATTMRAFVSGYHRRRAFVEIWLRGRTNPAVHAYGREHNRSLAGTLHAYAMSAGLARPELTEAHTLLAVEIGDRVFQLAFENDADGDPLLVQEGITLVTAYLERYATARGLEGVTR